MYVRAFFLSLSMSLSPCVSLAHTQSTTLSLFLSLSPSLSLTHTHTHTHYPLARAVTKTPKHHHVTPVLKSLHWLKVLQRIHCKIVSLTYKHSSNLSTLLHLPTSHHPTTRVYSLIIISVPISPSSLILSEVLQPLLCLRCTSSLERTPKRPPSVCISS